MDFSDISSWSPGRKKYSDFLKEVGKKRAKKPKVIALTKISTLKVYALMVGKLGIKPNGFYTSLISGYPVDNLIWWDYIIESEIGFINIIRHNSHLEAQFLVDDPNFDVDKFLRINIRKYRPLINKTIKTFEKHRTYINHYQSYKKCTEYLWEEVKSIKFPQLDTPKPFAATSEEADKYLKNIKEYIEKSVKFHALGKTLVLNAAFMAESYINLFIRVGAPPDLRAQKELLRLHLSSNFETKLKNLNVMSLTTITDVDMQSKEVVEVLKLMTLRNKYVHADENSPLNNLGDVYFDKLFPLLEADSSDYIIDSIDKTYHRPTLNEVRWSYKTSNKFIEYISSTVDKEVLSNVEFLMKQNPISFNEATNKYSAIYPENLVTAFGVTN